MIGIAGQSVSKIANPTVTATTYAAGKQVGSLVEIPQVAQAINRVTNLSSIVITDTNTNAGSVTYNIYFFSRSVTLTSSDTQTLEIGSTNYPYLIGKATVDSCFFSKPGGTSGVAVASLNIPVTAFPLTCDNTNKSIYYVIEVASASTASAVYAATTALTIKFTFNKEL